MEWGDLHWDGLGSVEVAMAGVGVEWGETSVSPVRAATLLKILEMLP